MMEMKDWISGLVGVIILCLGLFPLLNSRGIGPGWFGLSLPVRLLSWVIVGGGFYLIINSLIEITNSNVIGWVSFFIAAVITVLGILQVLRKITWISGIIFNIAFILLGLFLMIATFAMEM
ncbi:hypothetical protein KY358_06690 [Candidatus Woesearchaeota archaeon]|nr:hypothetical protein [Candidatus Woesearchaeota archaeon]